MVPLDAIQKDVGRYLLILCDFLRKSILKNLFYNLIEINAKSLDRVLL